MSIRYIEQRRAPRVELNAAGRIILVSYGLRIKESIDCTVVDISKGGALIDVVSAVRDREFYLEVDNDPGKLQQCLVVRRIGQNRVGVKFV
jgi:hypothetical protein